MSTILTIAGFKKLYGVRITLQSYKQHLGGATILDFILDDRLFIPTLKPRGFPITFESEAEGTEFMLQNYAGLLNISRREDLFEKHHLLNVADGPNSLDFSWAVVPLRLKI